MLCSLRWKGALLKYLLCRMVVFGTFLLANLELDFPTKSSDTVPAECDLKLCNIKIVSMPHRLAAASTLSKLANTLL